jgi:two-component system, cell cycle response regulator
MTKPPLPADDTERTRSVPGPSNLGKNQRALLVVLAGPQMGEMHVLPDGGPTVIGRKQGCGIRLDDDGVSRRHCSVEVTDEGLVLRDLQSANGTYVAGERIAERLLKDGDRFEIGIASALKFELADDLETSFQRQLSEAVLREPLTGLYNRRHFRERFAAELAASTRHNRALSLLLVDIDHFKQVNDVHGHVYGDKVLQMVAGILANLVRTEDVVARYGGEEFVVLAREADIDGATVLAERLRAGVARARCIADGKELSVTVSIGVTISIGAVQASVEMTQEELLKAADEALYRAKQQGRNRVVAQAYVPRTDENTPTTTRWKRRG